MRVQKASPFARAVFALIALSLSHSAQASSDVDVALRASFDSAPYLLELLEAAAQENQTAYFPLLDRIADGYFLGAETDEHLYKAFLEVLQDDGHISDEDTLSSFKLAASLHSAAPRIEAHYQFYNTSVEPLIGGIQGNDCSTWVHFGGKRYCSPALDESQGDVVGQKSTSERQLDRVLSVRRNLPPSILYADITEPAFGHFHKILSSSARQEKTSYRVRYTPPKAGRRAPLVISGYGVELALKRTDYIVIDDRGADKEDAPASEAVGEQAKNDLKPLSKSELSQLGLKTASYVLGNEDPFGRLQAVTQDFPLHSSLVASHSVSRDLMEDLHDERVRVLPPGYNTLWMNGIQFDAKRVDAHTLAHKVRNERKLISALKDFGLSGSDAKNLLINTSIAHSNSNEGPQRYDFRDEAEGGNVIVWMNSIEKDKRYKGFPSSLNARTYPGQLPPVRRDIHNIVAAIDFSEPEDVSIVVEQFQNFVKRSIPIRFGLVPVMKSAAATEQAQVVYYLLDAYGLSSVISYLEGCLKRKRCAKPDPSSFSAAVEGHTLRRGQTGLGLQEVLKLETLHSRLDSTRKYGRRLGLESDVLPVVVNGVAIPRSEDWLSAAVNRVNLDLRVLQQAVFDGDVQEDTWLPSLFLSHSTTRRNPLVIPEDASSIRFIDLRDLYATHKKICQDLPRWKAEPSSENEEWAHLMIVADVQSTDGKKFISEAVHVRQGDPNLEIVILHNPTDSRDSFGRVYDTLQAVGSEWLPSKVHLKGNSETLNSALYWESASDIVYSIGLRPGQNGLILNGRLVGPIPSTSAFEQGDFTQLLHFERTKRSKPIHNALSTLNLPDLTLDHQRWAELVSVVAGSILSSDSGDLYDGGPPTRVNVFEQWNTTHSAIEIGDRTTASISLVVAVDPASETAQRWVPILRTLSEIRGVHLKIIMNPQELLQELPIKRFYRYVLNPEPMFGEDGSVKGLSAHFAGLPKDSLLTVGLDVPPSWLVAPKESIHDLDNIVLNTLKDDQGVRATYELEHILIEGHSRDITTGTPPRGAQLGLGTQKDPHTTDTLVMANLGYFQFKANPGFWKMDLLSGRSQEVFKIESAGSKGYSPQVGDESTEIELLDFRGKTLFPRLSRNPGRETDDVLEAGIDELSSVRSYVSKGLGVAQRVLSKFGVAKGKQEHAEINIFSVASGHLYERMLNIMMVSVMKHTKHTVKFWFIEQFLSPSFKDSIPHIAAEYGFTYEMVTYKWPHWLRAQREKQREIWGYKILFLDVLFPLSLDKVIFVDADQIVRTDMYDLVTHDLEGAPYGFTPMCDSRTEMEGFRFWKQGYWASYLRGLPYHISALYVVDLRRFRQIAAGDRLRQQYHQLSADPNSLSNLDQDLPNHMQHNLPIHSLPQEWLWCETWCADEDLARARTIDLCNNPMTKEPKLDRARRQVPEWTTYDEEIGEVLDRRRGGGAASGRVSSHTSAVSSVNKHSKTHMSDKGEL
ncbi:MAG: hypothetical protein M1816_003834 [Peltula sp. TS41687]|nr:MAG: hypothetical protein M1816_003834 [Peltula sp. TS41687]